MLRTSILVVLASLAAAPAPAFEVKRDEPLVMRLIFEDCLGYIRQGRVPFGGLPTRPAPAAAIETLPASMPDRDKAVELLSPRYIASWGEDANARHCYVGSSYEADAAGVPALLGVPARGFLEHVTARATAEGLTENGVAEELSPLSTSFWSEPETGQDAGRGRPISFSMMATTEANAQGIADAGLIVMGGPAGGRR